MDTNTLITGIIIFFARIMDVSIGTVRTIITVQGRTVIAFFLGFVEVILWILIVSTVVNRIKETPILILFYALGFSTGNVVGILVERRLAFGMMVLRIIPKANGHELANILREKGQPVTIFTGEGMRGPVVELYVVCRRRDVGWILSLTREKDPDAFYITESARDVSKILQPFPQPRTGWRGIFKKK